MAIPLKQSTAGQEIPLGYFVDSTDGDTEETALTIANTDIKLWKAGATTLANKNSGGATHISNGIYYATLDATDTNTLGPLVVFVHVSGALPVRVECVVYAANVYDSLIGATDNLQVDATQISGDSTAADNLEAAADGTGYNLGGGQIVAASVTGNVGGNVSGSIGSLGAQAKLDVNAEADTALADINLDHLVKNAVDTNFATTVHLNSVIGQLADTGTTATYDRTTDSLEATRNHIGDGTNLTEAGGTGDHLTAIPWNAAWDAEVQSEATDALNAYDPPTNTEMEARTLLAASYATAAKQTTIEGKVDTVDSNVDAILADTGTDGVVVAAASKTGYKLASDGLDSVSTTAPAGVASNFREMVVQTWRRLFKKTTLTTSQLKTYADDGTTVVTTQAVSDDGTTQTQGGAT